MVRPWPAQVQDQVLEPFGLHRVQPRGRLIQEEQAGGRGQGPGDFQHPFESQGQDRGGLLGPVGQPHELQGLHGLVPDHLFFGAGPGELQGPGQEAGAAQAVAAHHDVFQDRHVVKELHQLEGAGDPLPGDAVGRESLDVLRPERRCGPAGGPESRVTRLNRVVLPAPLGPMTALTAPGGTPKLTCSTACRPPKARLTPCSSRSGWLAHIRLPERQRQTGRIRFLPLYI